MDTDTFDEDQTELEVLTRKPVCFIIIGKPRAMIPQSDPATGVGKTTLAKRLAAVWKCQLVDGSSTIEQAIRGGTPLGVQAKEKLLNGEELDEAFVAEIIVEKLNSPEIKHYGYVLDCLPSGCGQWRSVQEQVEFIRDLQLAPDIIINLKIPDQDLQKRRVGQKVDPLSNELFIKAVYDPDTRPQGKGKGKGQEGEGEGEEEGEGGEEEEEEEGEEGEQKDGKDDEFEEDLGELENLAHLAADIAGRLVHRPQDLPQSVQDQTSHYKDSMLRTLEDYIIQHHQQYVLELDANLSPKELFKSLLVRLSLLGLPRCPAPQRLMPPDKEEEEPEGIDTEQFLQQLSETGILTPNFRWHRSRWGRYCPVELTDGNMVFGTMEFAVGFLDKMYSLSSAEALVQFTRNPRAYLLPPQPRIPCKVCVVGPPTSGKTSLARAMAEKYNATVLEMQELLQPVVERAREAAIKEAESNAITNVTAQLVAQAQGHEGEADGGKSPEVLVTAEHPEVQKAVAEAEERARGSSPSLTQEMYMEALKTGIEQAEERRRQGDPQGSSHGGWVVDGFPLTRENWAAMIEPKLLPDFVLSLEDEEAPADYLLTRFAQLHGLPDPATFKPPAKEKVKEKQPAEGGEEEEGDKREEPEKPPAPVPEEIQQWQAKRLEFERQWAQLSSAIKGMARDPIPINCSRDPEEMLQSAVSQMEGVFEPKVSEFSSLQDDADMDDDPTLFPGTEEEEGEAEDESEEAQRKKKPWGDSSYYCPVALKEMGVLWPGNPDFAARYKERLYYFSSEEAKASFTADPWKYTVGQDGPLKSPPMRLFLLGPRGSGKTTVGRRLAEQLGVFHVGFRDLLQESILPKMKRPPLVDEDEWEGPEEEEEEGEKSEEAEGDDLDADVREKLSEEEAELRAYLLRGEQLQEETIERFAAQFWKREPYKSTGFIMEGFPSTGDELHYLATKGLFPDATAVMQVEEASCVVGRILPRRMEVWKRKRDRQRDRKASAREKRMREWEEDKAKRKAELTADYKEKMAAKKAMREEGEEEEEEPEDDHDEDEEEDPDTEEYREHLAELEGEEPPEEEEEEEEEEETDARERMMSTITEGFEEQNEAITSVQDVLTELQIPAHTVDASRKPGVVLYSLEKALCRYSTERAGLLAKCTPVDGDMAKKLLDHGYKQISKFKRWCPVSLSESPQLTLPPRQLLKSQLFPIIHRHRLYFTSSPQARERFMANPQRYLALPQPGPAVPVRLAVVGPPKSGKSTVARRFAQEYGCLRLSVGEAMRKVMAQFPDSELSQLMRSYLQVGQTVPDDLCVLALERALLDVQCNTRGYVLDGWPLTKAHVDLLTRFHIIPVCIVELEVGDQEVLRRGEIDRGSPNRPYPLHDSPAILLVRSTHYRRHSDAVRAWFQQEHDNWRVVDGVRSPWWVWEQVHQRALHSAQQIQQYLARVTAGQAASVAGLCITPSEFQSRLGEFSQYCPVSLARGAELVDCALQRSLEYAAEYRGKYYKMASQKELEAFLSSPERFVPPGAPQPLPPPELLPQRRSHADVKAMFPKQLEIQGFCPVSYVDGNKRYESLCPGNPELVAEYKEKLFCFASEEKLDKFMRQPAHYDIATLPTKLPPLRQPVPMTSLPMLGYLEQTVATALINTLSAVGSAKPKYPFLDSAASALLYMAYHLKAYNPKSNNYVRNKYKKKLAQFEETCQIIGYLSSSMRQGYREPDERAIDFQHKMHSFLKLKRETQAIAT